MSIENSLKTKFKIDLKKFKPQISGSNVNIKKIHMYDEKEIILGIKEEFEHTDDPYIALEIALAHLQEDKKYYSKMNEATEAGDISTIDVSLHGKSDGTHYKQHSFDLSDDEFKGLIKDNAIPHRVKLFADANKNFRIFMKHNSGVNLKLDKFYKGE